MTIYETACGYHLGHRPDLSRQEALRAGILTVIITLLGVWYLTMNRSPLNAHISVYVSFLFTFLSLATLVALVVIGGRGGTETGGEESTRAPLSMRDRFLQRTTILLNEGKYSIVLS